MRQIATFQHILSACERLAAADKGVIQTKPQDSFVGAAWKKGAARENILTTCNLAQKGGFDLQRKGVRCGGWYDGAARGRVCWCCQCERAIAICFARREARGRPQCCRVLSLCTSARRPTPGVVLRIQRKRCIVGRCRDCMTPCREREACTNSKLDSAHRREGCHWEGSSPVERVGRCRSDRPLPSAALRGPGLVSLWAGPRMSETPRRFRAGRTSATNPTPMRNFLSWMSGVSCRLLARRTRVTNPISGGARLCYRPAFCACPRSPLILGCDSDRGGAPVEDTHAGDCASAAAGLPAMRLA